MMGRIMGLLVAASVLCAGVHAQSRIINGAEVSSSDTQWSWIVSIQFDGSHGCGGSLIAPSWVLTAAHCFVDVDPSTVQIYFGSYDHEGSGEYTSVKAIYNHESYDDTTKDNDVALVELETPITSITPVALDRSSSLSAGTSAWVAGWGNMSTSSEEYPSKLMEVEVPLIAFDTCNGAQSYDGQLTQNMMCAGWMEGEKDACQGDSGGPLIAQESGTWKQVGVVSWGAGCAQENMPGIYAKVQNYIDWIEERTGTLGSTTPISGSCSHPQNITSLGSGWHLLGAHQDMQQIKSNCGAKNFWKYESGSWSSSDSVETGQGFWIQK